MIKTTPWFSAFGLAAVLVSAPSLSAGVIYQLETTEAGSKAATTVEVRAQDNRLKMSFEGADAQSEFVIFNAADETLTIASPDDRSYYVLEKGSLNQLTETLKAAQRQMEQALAQVPEGQRERMRQMMAGGMGGMLSGPSEPPKVEVEDTKESRTVEGYKTRKYVVRIDGERTAELWVTPWDNIEGSEEVRESLHNLAGFFTSLLDAMPQVGQDQDEGRSNWMRAITEIDGFPVESRSFKAGSDTVSEVTTLKSVRSEELGESDLSPPADFTRRSLELPRF